MSSAPDALQGYVDKWFSHQPEMAVAEAFVSPARKPLFRAWGALVNEWLETCFDLSDPGVARTKLAWWAQDMAVAEGPRHPVARAVLAAVDRPVAPDDWRAALLHAVPICGTAFGSRALSEELADLRPLSMAWAAVESQLFGVSVDAEAMQVHVQARRAFWSPNRPAAEPSMLKAQAVELLALSASQTGPLIAGCRARADRRRLLRLARHGDLQRARQHGHWQTLWDSWRAARSAG